ncbi:CDP-glycerol glycerophosphotransferase family protein [Halomonas kalidii]|uniref:CDP-glycerol glycerophosphotransferase family protein n=1 Tax=Halomonas kalidii TaxID=3043293 RepID=A0ABT6VL18_9GAMM|nr:CDP-glycerol glycerophosphotransferase family protein [Halomonas kalidii]MDI5934375.1 CDP-glycerol glycerophosphotransferase family protein [Halomonas kalidii]
MIVPRNRKLWVFGSSSGHKYADHSRMLFEHMHENRDDSGIRVVWSTKSDEIRKELTNRGYPVVKADSLSGFLTTVCAGVCIYTHYAHDHNRIAAFGAYKIQLWHGIPLKRFKAVSGLLEKGKAGRFSRDMHNRMLGMQRVIFPWANPTWDLLVFQSEVDRDRTGLAFSGTYRRGVVAGSIRGEYLKKKACENAKRTKRILYAPTHRELGRESLFKKVPAPDAETLTSALHDMQATLEVRLHPFQEKEPLPDVFRRDPVRHVDNSVCDDIYEDLCTFDLLITDYSSIFIDVLPLGMPVIFLAPDHLEYSSDDQGFFSEKYTVPGPVALSWSEALSLCDEILNNGNDRWRKDREEATQFYFGDGFRSESAMKNVVAEARGDLGL